MIKHRFRKIIYFTILFLPAMFLTVMPIAESAEFEIDEIVTAIKQEIKTANISELGSPKFKIETVDVALTVISEETEKGVLAVKIIGYGSEFDDLELTSKSYHNLSFSFRLSAASGVSPELSLGLVEPIKKVKSCLRKAYNAPRIFKWMDLNSKLNLQSNKVWMEAFGLKYLIYKI